MSVPNVFITPEVDPRLAAKLKDIVKRHNVRIYNNFNLFTHRIDCLLDSSYSCNTLSSRRIKKNEKIILISLMKLSWYSFKFSPVALTLDTLFFPGCYNRRQIRSKSCCLWPSSTFSRRFLLLCCCISRQLKFYWSQAL